MDTLANFHFLRPAWLLILLPFALVLLLELRHSDATRQWRPVIAAHLLDAMMVRNRGARVLSPRHVARGLAVLLAVAMAGPSWRQDASPFAADHAALIVAVDLSASMDERDIQPSRLQRARDKILQLVRARGDAATALIAYAGSAHTVLPLSSDADVLIYYLDALQVGMLPREGKSPEAVLPLAASLLAYGNNGATLLLISDGAANEAAAAFTALGDTGGMQLLVWGIGKTQAAIDADVERGLRSDAQPLQEAQLQAIAAAAGGHYVRVSSDDSDVRELQRRIERHYLTAGDSSMPWIDAGYYLVFPIMALFLFFYRRGWVLLQW